MEPDLDSQVATKIRVILAQRNVKQSALALQLGRDRLWLARRMTGEVSFRLDELQHICRVLEIDAATLLPASTGAAS